MKRFTDTDKWTSKPWFRRLPPRLKCLWSLLCDTCDPAGVIAPDWEITAEQILTAYPRRQGQTEALRIVMQHLRAGDDADAMLAGTRAIAAVVAELPSGANNAFVPGADKFFHAKRWKDDPATWKRSSNS